MPLQEREVKISEEDRNILCSSKQEPLTSRTFPAGLPLASPYSFHPTCLPLLLHIFLFPSLATSYFFLLSYFFSRSLLFLSCLSFLKRSNDQRLLELPPPSELSSTFVLLKFSF